MIGPLLVKNMRQKIAQWRKEQDSLSMRYKYLDQRANRGKRSSSSTVSQNLQKKAFSRNFLAKKLSFHQRVSMGVYPLGLF